MSAPLIPQVPKGPILFNATRRELLLDASIRLIVGAAVIPFLLKLRDPFSDRVFWTFLIIVESIIFMPLLLTLIFRKLPTTPLPTAEEITQLKEFERASNYRTVMVTIVSCFLSYMAVQSGRSDLLPYTMLLPMILLFQTPPRTRK